MSRDFEGRTVEKETVSVREYSLSFFLRIVTDN